MQKLVWTNIRAKLGDLKPWAENPRFSTRAQAERLIKSFDELGQFQTIAISPMLDVYDGHQRLSALLTVHGGDFEIDARQSNRPLTENERRRIVFAANVQAGNWDADKLAAWDAPQVLDWAGVDASAWQNQKREVAMWGEMLAAEKQEPPEDAEPQIDRAAELQEKWKTERGQLWAIGEHRLLCGDSTVREDVERVMGGELCELIVTDPPYGVSYADKNAFLNTIGRPNHIEKPIENDHLTKKETQKLWRGAFSNCYSVMASGAVIYCFMPQGGDQMMMMMMMSENIEPRHELIWLKNNHVLGRVDYAYKHEPIMYAWKEGGHKFYGDFQTSVIECSRPQSSKLHPTMKPVELIERLIFNSSKAGGTLYEPFAGSGTTLVACQNLGRKCRAIEISPAYTAVVLQRMADAFPELEVYLVE